MIAKVLLNRSFEATLRYVLKPDAVLIDTNEPTAALSLDPHLIAARMNDMLVGVLLNPVIILLFHLIPLIRCFPRIGNS